MSAIHRRATLRAMLGSGAVLPLASLIPDPAKSQSLTFGAGFNLAEASDLLYMCDKVYPQPLGVPQPPGFTQRWGSDPIFTPPFAFLGQFWTLWQNNSVPSTYAIIVRGTVLTFASVLEDLLSFLVPATDSFTIGGHRVSYKFAADVKASVHAGFALGTLLLLNAPFVGILAQLKFLPAQSNIYIAGHSQGAGAAVLLASYLNYAAPDLQTMYSLKTYAFAQPKPGNDHYETDFGDLFCNTGLAFRLTNSLDFIPQLPFTWESPTDLNIKFPLRSQTGVESFLTTLNAGRSEAVRSIFEASKARLRDTALAIARTQNPLVADRQFTIPHVDSLYFVNAATEIALIGTPCQCDDRLFQHHTTTYYTLMQEQLHS